MMIQLKSFTNDAASRTKGLLLKTKLEHAISEGEKIYVDFEGIDKFAFLLFLITAFLHLEFNMVLK